MTMKRSVSKIIKDGLKGLDYQRIVLFGSRARGQASATSDYDLLIILKKDLTVQQKMKIAGKLRKKFAQKGLDADIIVKSESEIRPSKARIGSVVRRALAEGVSL